MKKKILAAALAMTMMLGSSVGALASGSITAPTDGIYGADVKATSTMETPTISVDVPTTLEFKLNPYQMEVDSMKDQVVAASSDIVNKSDIAISINVMDLGAVKVDNSELTLLAAPPAADLKTKSAFLYVELKEDGDANKYQTTYKASNKTQLAVPVTKTASKTDMLTLAAGASTNTKANIKVAGNIVANPSKAWTDDDTIELTFKLTFTPQVNK